MNYDYMLTQIYILQGVAEQWQDLEDNKNNKAHRQLLDCLKNAEEILNDLKEER